MSEGMMKYVIYSLHSLWIHFFHIKDSRAAAPECKTTTLGKEYNGVQFNSILYLPNVIQRIGTYNIIKYNVTKSGRICQRWDSHVSHSHTGYNTLEPENYCRNPDSEPQGPWCYTMDPARRWEYCTVPFCPTTTVSMTTAYSGYSSRCVCSCSQQGNNWSFLLYQNLTYSELKDAMKNQLDYLERILSVDKKLTSASIRRRTSAYDGRRSSANLGAVAIFIICMIVSLFICVDCTNIICIKRH